MLRTGTLLLAVSCAAVVAAQAQTIRHVWTNSPSPGAPYNAWSNASHTIQEAIDAAVAANGDWVWVTNGVYDTGGRVHAAAGAGLTNRVVIDKAIVVRSVNGPSNTFIVGCWHNPGGAPANSNYFGDAAVRCVYIANGAQLIGFTLTNGSTRTGSGTEAYACGGGVLGASSAAVITNCVIIGNRSHCFGGGVRGCLVYDSTVEKNISALGGGGGYQAVFYNCKIKNNGAPGNGGGIFDGTAHRCMFLNNSAGHGGGGSHSFLYSCLITDNYANNSGGGANMAKIYNSTIIGNSAGGNSGGVSYSANVYNSIIYYNVAPYDKNYLTITSYYCCTLPLPPVGSNNITNEPRFVDRPGGNIRLSRASPCFNTGTNFTWMSDPADLRGRDLDGGPRIQHGTVDMGAYELRVPRGSFFSAE